MKTVGVFISCILLASPVLAASDAARVSGDLKVDGIHFSADGSVLTKAPKDGKSILNGSGAPSVAGNIGDFYIDTTNNRLYGPYAGSWGAGVSLVGPQGSQGNQGPPGPVGPQGPVSNLSQELYDSVCAISNTGLIARPSFCKKLIFLSNNPVKGDFGVNGGAFAAADNICQSDASSAGLPGTYKAYISTSNTSAVNRLTHYNYNYVLPNGTVIANSWDDLVCSPLLAQITKTASGSDVVNATLWVGSARAREGLCSYISASGQCDDWTSSSWYGAISRIWQMSYLEPVENTDNSYATCSNAFHLLCIQQ